MLKEHQANQPKSDTVIEDIESTPVAEKNIIDEKPVKESTVEEKPVKESTVEEKPKSKGILSGIKSLFSKK